MPDTTATPTTSTDTLDAILTALTDSADPLVSEWATALIDHGERTTSNN